MKSNTLNKNKSGTSIFNNATTLRILYVYLIDFFILFSIFLTILFMEDEHSNLPTIGILIVILTIYMCIKVKSNRLLLFLFSILSFINISVGISDMIRAGAFVADWQISFRNTVYNLYTAKSTLLFLGILNIFFSLKWLKENESERIVLQRKNNLVIAIVGLLALVYILITGYSSDVINSTGYTSNSNALYEYAIIIFITVWFYSGRNKVINIFLGIFAIVYILQSLTVGDRSAAFLMLILYFLLYFRDKVSLPKMIILAILAIIISNFIAEYRDDKTQSLINIVLGGLDRGVYSDTVSYAYFTSITITALKAIDISLSSHFFEYLKGFILGSRSTEYSNLAVYARDNYRILFNRGGGLFPSHFYAFFGYLGVIVSSSVLALTLKFFFSKKNDLYILYQLLIVTYSLRWYLYNPINLYRVVIIVFTILILICLFYDNISKKSK